MGAQFSPRILSPHNADTYSLKTFAQFPRWRDLQGDAKVYAIYQYLADRRTGIFPMGVPAWEGPEVLSEYGAVRDPIKMLNVYPIGHCGTLGPTMAGIMEGMGVGPSRTLALPGPNHVVAEVFYNNHWHYLDLDLRTVFRRPDGSLASMAEAKTDRSLWRGPNTPLFFPLDDLEKMRAAYAQTAVQYYYGYYTGGHTMDFVLRRGETFTRWWRPQGGRWNHHASYAAAPYPRRLLEQEPRGPKCKHPSFTIYSHGNGRFVYQPNLIQGASDFEDGVFDAQNVAPAAAGFTLEKAGEGYAIFEVRSPYVIVPVVSNLDQPQDEREASVVTVNAAQTTLALSLDHGLTWKSLGDAPGTYDLSSQVKGTYGYLLKVQLKGEPGKALVRSMQIVTWVQLHPASLPALRKGANQMHYVQDDHYGLPTRVVEIHPNGGDRSDLLKYLSQPPADYDPARRTSRIHGQFIARVSAPPASRIAWFSAGGSFATFQGGAAPNTRNAMAYAVEEPHDFKNFYQAAVPSGNNHWHYNADVEVKLDTPAKNLFIQYTGNPAINNIRLYAHCLEERPRPAAPMRITHAWREKGNLKTKSLTLQKPGTYEIVTEEEPEDEYVEMAVPSNRN